MARFSIQRRSPLRTRWLPTELWMRVAYYLPRMPNQPKWQPWIKHRKINRAFKKAIEDFYIKHWLEGSVISFECDSFLPQFENTRYPIKEIFTFTRCTDSEDRTAVYEGLLPMDLQLKFTSEKSSFTFDWRKYLSTLLDELRRIDGFEARYGHKTQVQLALKLDKQLVESEITLLEKTHKLAQKAGTPLIGKDGRLLEIRRGRRYRLGIASRQLPPHTSELHKVLVQRFTHLDEEHVAEKLLDMAWDDNHPVDLQW